MRRGSWLLVGLVSVICVRPSAQSLDERAIRELAGRFFSAYAEEDGAAIAAMVSRRSPHYAALVEALGRGLALQSDRRDPTFGRIRIQDARATSKCSSDLDGRDIPGVVSAEQLLLCERGGTRGGCGTWRPRLVNWWIGGDRGADGGARGLALTSTATGLRARSDRRSSRAAIASFSSAGMRTPAGPTRRPLESPRPLEIGRG